MAETRVVLFDLDDTLYPRRSFLLSGFRAVAERLQREHGLPAAAVFETLRDACDGGARGHELQRVCDRFAVPGDAVPALVEVIREHVPSIELPASSIRVLRSLRATWRIGILTNGLPRVQKRKVAALGIQPLVDAVIYAAECGERSEKPASAGFLALLQRLGGTPGTAVFVGDDPHADIAGAARLGLKTVYVRPAAAHTKGDVSASAAVTSIAEVPDVLERLIPWRMVAHVA